MLQEDIEGDKFGLKQIALTAFMLVCIDFVPFLEFLIPSFPDLFIFPDFFFTQTHVKT